MDSNYKEFILNELRKRNLSTSGTMRILEQRYQNAVLEEANQRERDDNEGSQVDSYVNDYDFANDLLDNLHLIDSALNLNASK